MSDGYRCVWGCKSRFASFREARDHGPKCPTRKARLDNLGLDLVVAVDAGKMKLEEAEAAMAERPKLRLD